jgi:hypothetical protein
MAEHIEDPLSDFARYIAGEIDKWTKVVAFARIKVN